MTVEEVFHPGPPRSPVRLCAVGVEVVEVHDTTGLEKLIAPSQYIAIGLVEVAIDGDEGGLATPRSEFGREIRSQRLGIEASDDAYSLSGLSIAAEKLKKFVHAGVHMSDFVGRVFGDLCTGRESLERVKGYVLVEVAAPTSRCELSTSRTLVRRVEGV
jgi:hypothetical protein